MKAPARVLVFKVLERRGGGWHPVTGGVDGSEEFSEGAKRELQEETGFDPEFGTFVDLEFSYSFGDALERPGRALLVLYCQKNWSRRSILPNILLLSG